DWPIPKVLTKPLELQPQIIHILCRTPVFALSLNDRIGEFRHRYFAAAHALQVIDSEFQGINDRLAIFRKLLPRSDEIRKLVLRQCDCFSPVSLKSCKLPESLRVRFRTCLEKHSPLAPRTEIE